MTDTSQWKRLSGASARLLLVLLTLATALALAWGGFRLLGLGGTPYYLLAGLAYLALAVLLAARHRFALLWTTAIFIATCGWALYETDGLDYWPLLPRLIYPALLLMLTLWACARFPSTPPRTRRLANASAGIVFLGLFATLVGAFFPHGAIKAPAGVAPRVANLADVRASDDWRHFGRSASGTRFAPDAQITPSNVGQLRVAWTYRTGRQTTGAGAGVDENTPLQVGDVLYSCTPQNIVTALDADNGKPLWRYDPHARTAEHVTCRGVGYHDAD